MYDWVIIIFLASIMIYVLALAIMYMSASPDGKKEFRKNFSGYMALVSALFSFVSALSKLFSSSKFDIFDVIQLIVLFSSLPMVMIWHFSIGKAIVAFIAKKMSFLNAEANDLIAKLLMEKNNKNLITYSSLFVSFLVEYVIYRQTPEFPMLIAMALTFVLLALTFANQQILYYRLKCGLYGTCASEAKEIIAYIIEQMNDKNNSGGLPKLVFKEEELAERVLSTDGGEEYAG